MDGGSEEKVLYFMEQTNERLTRIEAQLIVLITFRAEVVTEAKNKASNVAILYAIVGFVLTTGVNVILRRLGI